MNIKYKDIETISHALCYAHAMIEIEIEELKKKGFLKVVPGYETEKESTQKAMESLQKIRKELHLIDDIAYKQKFETI